MATTPLPVGFADPCARAIPAPTDAARSATTTRRTTLFGSFRTIFMPLVVPAVAKTFMSVCSASRPAERGADGGDDRAGKRDRDERAGAIVVAADISARSRV